MRIAIMQPTYLPWIGYFDLIDRCDIFVLHDDIKFDHQSWQHRNRTKSANGVRILSVPISKKKSQSHLIKDIQITSDPKWSKKHLACINQDYQKSIYYKTIFKPYFSKTYKQKWTSIEDLNISIIKYIMDYLQIKTPLIKTTPLNISGQKVDKLIKICKALNATEYLSPIGSFSYIEENNLFPENNIQLYYQHFEHPTYSQLYGDFLPYMAAIDLLFNEGVNSLDVLRSGQQPFYTHEEIHKLRIKNGEST